MPENSAKLEKSFGYIEYSDGGRRKDNLL